MIKLSIQSDEEGFSANFFFFDGLSTGYIGTKPNLLGISHTLHKIAQQTTIEKVLLTAHQMMQNISLILCMLHTDAVRGIIF